MTKKRRFLVMQRKKNLPKSFTLRGRKYEFGKDKNAGDFGMYVDDPGVAKEIEDQIGLKGTGDVWVKEHDRMNWLASRDAERGDTIHHYTFGFSHIPEDIWNRIFKK
jgi:hypothetical protein